MKCQIQFYGKKIEKYFNMPSAEHFTQTVLSLMLSSSMIKKQNKNICYNSLAVKISLFCMMAYIRFLPGRDLLLFCYDMGE